MMIKLEESAEPWFAIITDGAKLISICGGESSGDSNW